MAIEHHIRSTDLAKDIATLALTSRANYDGDRLKEIINYCMAQLEHRLSPQEILPYAKTLVAPYEGGD